MRANKQAKPQKPQQLKREVLIRQHTHTHNSLKNTFL